MRLGFHYHIPALKKDGNIYLPGYLGRFLDNLADDCQSLTCFLHTPVGSEIDQMDYALQNKKIDLVDIGGHTSVPRRMVTAGRVKSIIRAYCGELDALLIRGPSPLLPQVASACQKLPLALLLVGDYLAGIDDLPQPTWRKELIRLWSKWNATRQIEIAKKALVFVNSHLLYQQLKGQAPHLVETRTTTLSASDFYEREDTCQSKPVRLLYTGRMDRSKGLMDILAALHGLIAAGEDLVWDLVGMPVKGDPVLDELFARANEYGLGERIKFHGYKPLGPELFDFYKRSDIYILASQSSFEGFPRTIWEAMAHGLPVVATSVGSIPDYISDCAALVKPRSPDDLNKSISKIISDQELRRKNIKRGMFISKQNTLEARSKELISSIRNYLNTKN